MTSIEIISLLEQERCSFIELKGYAPNRLYLDKSFIDLEYSQILGM